MVVPLFPAAPMLPTLPFLPARTGDWHQDANGTRATTLLFRGAPPAEQLIDWEYYWRIPAATRTPSLPPASD